MRYLDDGENPAAKRPRRAADSDVGSSRTAGAADKGGDEPIRIRRLTVIFNSVAPPGSLDYIITASGINALPDSEASHRDFEYTSPPRKVPAAAAVASTVLDTPAASSVVNLDDVGVATDDDIVSSEGADAAENGPLAEEEDEWDAYWKQEDLSSDIYSQIDFDAISSSLISSSHPPGSQ